MKLPKQKVYILTAGGTARELRERLEISEQYLFQGYLDDIKQGPEILGTLQQVSQYFQAGGVFLSALGSYRGMEARRNTLSNISLEQFTSFVDPLTLCYVSANLGKDLVIFPFSIISANVTIGNHCLIYHHVTVSHDTCIGDFSILSNNVCVSGNVNIGENCYIGASAVINEGRYIGKNVIVASNASVICDIPDNKIYLSKHDIRENYYLKKSLN